MKTHERLSAQDAVFLYGESAVAHMHVGSLAVFERLSISEEELGQHIAARLHMVPRFRKKLAWVPAGLGRPVWVDDPDFDIRFHVRYTGLPKPAGLEEAKRLMGRLMSIPLDRKRPLWEMWLFDMEGGRTGMVQKTHHCLIDGISGVDVGTVMLDMGPKPTNIHAPPFEPQAAPTPGRLVREAFADAVLKPRDLFTTMRVKLGGEREVTKQQAGEVARGLLSWGKASLAWAPRTLLCEKIGAHRRFDTMSVDLATVKSIKNRFACTVNDVVLAVVAGGLGFLLRQRGEDTTDLVMKAMVPVSVRDPSQRMSYGNQVSMMAAELPVGERDPEASVRFVGDRMRGLKESKQAVGADFWVKLSEYAPPTVLALAARAAALQRVVNLVVTNVPGPQFSLYLHGAKLLQAYPCAPILGTAALSVAVLSYDGQLNFGLNGDWDVVPDLALLAEGMQAVLKQLAVG